MLLLRSWWIHHDSPKRHELFLNRKSKFERVIYVFKTTSKPKKTTVFSFFSNSKYISLATLRMFIKSISNPNLISWFCNTWNDTSPKALQLFWIWEFDVWRGDCDWLFFSAKHCFQALVFGKVSTQWGMSFQSMESVVDFSCRCWSSPLVFRDCSFWDIYIIHDW